MWAAIKSVFATPKVVDAAFKGLDAAVFTAEEKSEFFLKWLQASAPQNLARRIIAFMVVLPWTLMVLTIFSMTAFEVDTAAEREFMTDTVNPPFMIIIGFYFLAHVIRSANGKKKS